MILGVSSWGTWSRAFCSRSPLLLPEHKSCGPWHSCLSWPHVSLSVSAPALCCLRLRFRLRQRLRLRLRHRLCLRLLLCLVLCLWLRLSLSVVSVLAPAHDSNGLRVVKVEVDYVVFSSGGSSCSRSCRVRKTCFIYVFSWTFGFLVSSLVFSFLVP